MEKLFKVARDPFKKKEALHSTRIRAFASENGAYELPLQQPFLTSCVALSGKITKEGDRQRVECAVLCQRRLCDVAKKQSQVQSRELHTDP